MKCPACNGKGGWMVGDVRWDHVSGPEQDGERCEECEGTGKAKVYFAVLNAAIRNDAIPIGHEGNYRQCERDDPEANEFRVQTAYVPGEGAFNIPVGKTRKEADWILHILNKCFDLGVKHAQAVAKDSRTEVILPGRMGYRNRNEESMP